MTRSSNAGLPVSMAVSRANPEISRTISPRWAAKSSSARAGNTAPAAKSIRSKHPVRDRRVKPPPNAEARSLPALDNRCDSLPAAHAHRKQPITAAGPVQLVHRLDGEDAAGRANRVTQRDRAAVGIDLGRIHT